MPRIYVLGICLLVVTTFAEAFSPSLIPRRPFHYTPDLNSAIGEPKLQARSDRQQPGGESSQPSEQGSNEWRHLHPPANQPHGPHAPPFSTASIGEVSKPEERALALRRLRQLSPIMELPKAQRDAELRKPATHKMVTELMKEMHQMGLLTGEVEAWSRDVGQYVHQSIARGVMGQWRQEVTEQVEEARRQRAEEEIRHMRAEDEGRKEEDDEKKKQKNRKKANRKFRKKEQARKEGDGEGAADAGSPRSEHGSEAEEVTSRLAALKISESVERRVQ